MLRKKLLIGISTVAVLVLAGAILTRITLNYTGSDNLGGKTDERASLRDWFAREREPTRMSFEELKATEDIQIFTHFPFDFKAAFANPEQLWLEPGHIDLPIIHDFYPPAKVSGAKKWYTTNPHDPLVWDEETDVYFADWEWYLVADGTVSLDSIQVDRTIRNKDTHGSTLRDISTDELVQTEVNGETVYRGLAVRSHKNDYVTVLYGKMQLRKAIVDKVIAAGGSATFPAGTRMGYGLGEFMVDDDRVDMTRSTHPGVNPFDYFVEEKQQELLALYEPLYEMFKKEGVHPFNTDLTKAHLYWDHPRVLEGLWTSADTVDDVDPNLYSRWSVLTYIGEDKINKETYWRVLEHPWNIEHNFTGIFVNEPDNYWRFYQIEGDLSSGIAMIIQEDDREGWNPLRPDSAENHPSMGERYYIRYEVNQQSNMWDETLTIQEFVTEEEARAGFTDNTRSYRRGYWPDEMF